jgi:hypothetical protein
MIKSKADRRRGARIRPRARRRRRRRATRCCRRRRRRRRRRRARESKPAARARARAVRGGLGAVGRDVTPVCRCPPQAGDGSICGQPIAWCRRSCSRWSRCCLWCRPLSARATSIRRKSVAGNTWTRAETTAWMVVAGSVPLMRRRARRMCRIPIWERAKEARATCVRPG